MSRPNKDGKDLIDFHAVMSNSRIGPGYSASARSCDYSGPGI